MRRLRRTIRAMVSEAIPDVQWIETHTAEEARVAAAEAGAGDTVVAAGGDGTVHVTLMGLARSGFRAGLGIIPVGTGNDFAHAMGLPAGPQPAIQSIARGESTQVDLGWVRIDDGQEEPFLNAVGAGFDAAASIRSRTWRFLPGLARYLVATMHTLAVWRSPEATVNGQAWSGSMMFGTIGNGARSGGAFLITPDADPCDGVFQACLVDHLPALTAMRVIPRVIEGSHRSIPAVTLAEGTEFLIGCPAGLPVHADGEILARSATRVACRIEPGRLRFVGSRRTNPTSLSD
ncbi:MAG: hypothetical protein JJ896_03640 [Rhodothermales bacterium]|nr:hypothetical protein [Rhodothermales bacterium]MBO6778727.1 hypothetical protein [Rhodothermales bacterium]